MSHADDPALAADSSSGQDSVWSNPGEKKKAKLGNSRTQSREEKKNKKALLKSTNWRGPGFDLDCMIDKQGLELRTNSGFCGTTRELFPELVLNSVESSRELKNRRSAQTPFIVYGLV